MEFSKYTVRRERCKGAFEPRDRFHPERTAPMILQEQADSVTDRLGK